MIIIVLTTLFKDDIRDITKAEINTDFTHIAIGIGTSVPAIGDTTLESEVLRNARQETSIDANSRTVSMFVASTQANSNDITEIGTLDQASAGNLWHRNTFTAISKTSDIELWFDVKITINVIED